MTEIIYFQRGLYQDDTYIEIINPILNNERVQEMRKYMHHGQVDCLSHSLHVSYVAYKMGKKFKIDHQALARAGMLHDFYLYDWHIKGDREGFHGLTHAQSALENAEEHFKLSERERDIIKWHMWPLNIGMPKFKESWVMMFADRYCTIAETFHIAFRRLSYKS